MFKKKLQFLWDIEQKVYLISSYQRISCQKELFQQTSLKNSKFLQYFDTLRRVFVFRFHYSSWPAWRIKNRRITLTFGGSLYIRVVLHFEQKHWVWGLPICILRFQGNKLKKPLRGFKKLILFWKLTNWILAGLLNFSASKYSETNLVKNFKIPENCESFALLIRKNSDFCYRICILRNRRNILVENILVQEYSGKLCF